MQIRSKLPMMILALALGLACVGGAIYGGSVLLNIPLGPPLAVTSGAAEAAEALLPQEPTEEAALAQDASDEGDEATALLFLGVDPEQEAEAIYLLRTDPDAGTVEVISLPPSLEVPVQGLESLGISQASLKTIYTHGLTLPNASAGAATNLVAQALADNFGLTPTHYVVMNEAQFIAYVDKVGGIDLNIPADFGEFKAGQQHLNGEATWHYVRDMSAPGLQTEVPRIERQRQALAALRSKLLSAAALPMIPDLVAGLLGGNAVATDLSVEEGLELADALQAVPESQIKFVVVDEVE